MAWSTARMPVEAQSQLGVAVVTSGSRKAADTHRFSPVYRSLTLRSGSVEPAKLVNYPADNVVVMEICGKQGFVGVGTSSLSGYWKRMR